LIDLFGFVKRRFFNVDLNLLTEKYILKGLKANIESFDLWAPRLLVKDNLANGHSYIFTASMLRLQSYGQVILVNLRG
jgi:hypothetical protein